MKPYYLVLTLINMYSHLSFFLASSRESHHVSKLTTDTLSTLTLKLIYCYHRASMPVLRSITVISVGSEDIEGSLCIEYGLVEEGSQI